MFLQTWSCSKSARTTFLFGYIVASASISLLRLIVTTGRKLRVLPAAEAAFRLVPAVPWDTPIDCHYQALTTCWHSAAAALSTEQQEQPVQAYLSEATLRIVHIRQALRRYLVDESREIRRRTCLIAFAAFLLHARHQQFTTRAAGVADHWLRSMDISEAVAVALLRWHGRQLRAAVAQDRRAYLDRLTRGHYTRPSAKPSRPPKLHAEATSFLCPSSTGTMGPLLTPLKRGPHAGGGILLLKNVGST